MFSIETLKTDLIQYTGMNGADVEAAIKRLNWSNTRADFNFMNPKSLGELNWFNRTSKTFLFECAIHLPWFDELSKLPKGGRILDYGAGLGTDCMWLYIHGYKPCYFDIGLVVSDFFKWRCRKYEINIPVIKPFCNGLFDYVECVSGSYDGVVFRDVLEHIPDYVRVLETVLGPLQMGSRVLIQAPFEDIELGVHMKEKWPVSDWMVNHGFKRLDSICWEKING